MQTDIHALSGIRTHNPSVRTVKMFLALDLAATVICNVCPYDTKIKREIAFCN
jgi:hypothetical protein